MHRSLPFLSRNSAGEENVSRLLLAKSGDRQQSVVLAGADPYFTNVESFSAKKPFRDELKK